MEKIEIFVARSMDRRTCLGLNRFAPWERLIFQMIRMERREWWCVGAQALL